MLVDHALAYGWDADMGGFYEDGTTFGKAEDKRKEWWVQFEGLNSLLLMHEKYGKETSKYFNAFQKQWRFIAEHQIDSEFHGVYQMVGADGKAENPTKGQIWKAAYHDGRALLNVTARLKRLAGQAPEHQSAVDQGERRDRNSAHFSVSLKNRTLARNRGDAQSGAKSPRSCHCCAACCWSATAGPE